MEKISLPTRIVATRRVVVIPVAIAVIVVMLMWVAVVVYYDVVSPYYMRDFRRVVITGETIKRYRGGEVAAEYTLFIEDGGIRHALAGRALKGFSDIDWWHAEMRYLFARALWREYNGHVGTGGMTSSGYRRGDLFEQTLLWLRRAIRYDPTNRFYRATFAGVLQRVDAEKHAGEINRLLLFYPPQNAYGQVRTAETLHERGAPKAQVRINCRRALELVSSDVTSGLVDTSAAEPSVTSYPALAPRLVSRVVTVLLKDGAYDTWADVVPDYPESRWLVANELRSRGMSREADREFTKVVESVNRRLSLESRVSLAGSAFELLCPLVPMDRGRFLMNREIGLAAGVLKDRNRFGDAAQMYRVQISRAPTDVSSRLALGEALLAHAAVLRTRARDFTDRGNSQRAGELRTKSEEMCEEVDRQVSHVLALKPRLSAALNLRARIPRRGGAVPTP